MKKYEEEISDEQPHWHNFRRFYCKIADRLAKSIY